MSVSRPTLADVAAHAGVSISTASIAFSDTGSIAEGTRARILDSAQALGYAGPSALGRQLRSGRTGIIGVVLDSALKHTFRDPVSIRVLDGISRSLGERGFGVLLIPGATDPMNQAVINPLLEVAAFDAAILTWGGQEDDPAYEVLARKHIPMVFAEGRPAGNTPLVNVRDREGTEQLTRHLLALGHRNIAVVTLNLNAGTPAALVTEPITEDTWLPSHDRLLGVYDAGVTPVAIWQSALSLIEDGQLAAKALLDPSSYASPDLMPTAIIAQSDLLAIGVMQEARAMGLRVPEDVSVAGFDGIDLAWLGSDKLTTVSQPLEERGERLAQAVLELLDTGHSPNVLLPIELSIGSTTGPVPAR